MKMSKFARTVLVPAAAVLALSGAALADSADINTTGPDSYNKIEIETSNHVEISNHNNVTVTNNNTQTATTGDASVNGNTTGGSAMSGAASNSNTTTTTVTIDNQSSGGNGCTVCGGGGQGGGSNGGGNVAGGSNASGKGGGSGAGSSVGSGMLPVTGPSLPIDVSALRQAFSPSSATAPLDVAGNRTSATILLSIAAVLGLLGAVGSAVYSTKRTLKV